MAEYKKTGGPGTATLEEVVASLDMLSGKLEEIKEATGHALHQLKDMLGEPLSAEKTKDTGETPRSTLRCTLSRSHQLADEIHADIDALKSLQVSPNKGMHEKKAS